MRYLVIPLIVSVLVISGCSIKDCKDDLSCFEKSVKKCSKAKVNIKYEDNDVRLTSRGIWGGKCQVSLKVEKVGKKLRQKDPIASKIAEGKTMNCAIPLKEINKPKQITELFLLEQKFNQYCSGPIKDAMQGPLKEMIQKKLK